MILSSGFFRRQPTKTATKSAQGVGEAHGAQRTIERAAQEAHDAASFGLERVQTRLQQASDQAAQKAVLGLGDIRSFLNRKAEEADRAVGASRPALVPAQPTRPVPIQPPAIARTAAPPPVVPTVPTGQEPTRGE